MITGAWNGRGVMQKGVTGKVERSGGACGGGAGGVRRAPELLGSTRWRPAGALQGQRDTIVTGGEEKLNGGAFSPPSATEEIAARSRPGVGVEGSRGFTEPWRCSCAGRSGAECNGAAAPRRRRVLSW